MDKEVRRERGGVEGLSMVVTYNQVENFLGMHFRYSQIL